ncbi:Cytokinin dehydrogenase [Dionaea muscipula]
MAKTSYTFPSCLLLIISLLLRLFKSFVEKLLIIKPWRTRTTTATATATATMPNNNKSLIIISKHDLPLDISTRLRLDSVSTSSASGDFGNLVHATPAGVFYPSSVNDIVSLVNFSYNQQQPSGAAPLVIAARGRGHSVRGQALAKDGVVVDMCSLNGGDGGKIRVMISTRSSVGWPCGYVDVGGEQMWIDVLRGCLDHGVAPLSWTDYLYLTVGGTLSNAGISGQTFRYGPQITNVSELDVVTGRGELVTCSRKMNSELFFAVLGGLGQFGIITRARILVRPAPKRVKWVRMLYDDFVAFTRDEEQLISVHGDKEGVFNGLNYVEGSLIMHQSPPNNWRSSFFSSSDVSRITSLDVPHGIIYCLEVVKYYDDHDVSNNAIDKELEELLEGLSFIPGFCFTRDVTFEEFLNRVRKGELELESKGLWEVPHPWLNLFIPGSRILDFNSEVFARILNDQSKATGPFLLYPMLRNKWDDRMSAVIPEEDVFYTIGLLHSSGFDDWEIFQNQNEAILLFCEENGIKVKQYLPHYTDKDGWKNHFGSKWERFWTRKARFDPKMILSPGQRIFN